MLFKWVDYCEKYEEELETWTGDEDTRRFATFDKSIKEKYYYYVKTCSDYNEAYWCKVVLDGDIIAAFLFISRNNEYPYQVTLNRINLIIVNPKYRNKSYGTKIIKELVRNANEIIQDGKSSFIVAIDLDNKVSLKIAEKSGFVLAGINTEDDFSHWVYPAAELENFRKFIANNQGENFTAVSTL